MVGAAVGLSLRAVNLPDRSLVYTNKVVTSKQDVEQLCGEDRGYINIKDCIFTVEANPQMEVGTIGLNKFQREFAKIGLNAEVYAKNFVVPKLFDIGSCKLEVDFLQKPAVDARKLEIRGEDLEKAFLQRFETQVFCQGQPLAFDHEGSAIKIVVTGMAGLDLGTGEVVARVAQGILTGQSELDFTQGVSGKLHILSNKMQQHSVFRPDFNFEELGIGGLSKEFGDIFRRAFASRVFPPRVVRDLGINHVRGMLLHGPPGTGKTLIARQLAKFLKAAEPKIVNGPEVLNKYVGQAEENIRTLFADAEREYKQQGESSQLHVIIFDEIDSICRSRGTNSDSTGTHDSIVNQLLSKIDGVDSLNNILLIGMTNRIDLIDEALLRSGRLELHVEISLPDEKGRIEILNIHTKGMRETGYLDKAVSVPALATQTKNFSGAEIEGLIRAATSYSLSRKVNFQDITKSGDMGAITVTGEDFQCAFEDVKPSFGRHEEEFGQCVPQGITQYSKQFEKVFSSCLSLLDQVRNSANTPLLTVLLHGAPGCGKTALSAHLAGNSEYPFVRRIAPESHVGKSESGKMNAIVKVFEDAYKSPLSCIVLDDVERLVDYVRIGPRFSNTILQALFALLKKKPPEIGRKLIVIGTTSDRAFMEDSELCGAFNAAFEVPTLTEAEHFEAAMQCLPGFTATTAQEISAALAGKRVGIKTLLAVAEMAVQRQNPVQKDTFMEWFQSAGCFY